ncbi:MAG TPA: Hpt domain-containing protein [Burkholderiaceae bacterium]|jgi:HPt (histidine-containing phosphotransfer) domain-containing protein|nr:Hpt domain-containing protein [Burkholderiaceae bacterium]
MLEIVGGDREIFLQLAEIFRRESVAIFEKMRSAAGMHNFKELGDQSHSLKGTVGPLGADELVKMLLQIEDECNELQCICDENRLSKIDNELSQIQIELQQFVDRF